MSISIRNHVIQYKKYEPNIGLITRGFYIHDRYLPDIKTLLHNLEQQKYCHIALENFSVFVTYDQTGILFRKNTKRMNIPISDVSKFTVILRKYVDDVRQIKTGYGNNNTVFTYLLLKCIYWSLLCFSILIIFFSIY